MAAVNEILETVTAIARWTPEQKAEFDRLQFGSDVDDKKERWRADPVLYADEALGIKYLTPDQIKILRGVLIWPHKIFLRSGHSIGKSFLLAILVNWFFDCWDPGACISTAPRDRDIKDILWKEVRMMRLRAGLSMPFIGPAAPEMKTSPDHYAVGYTARVGESFQGRHDLRMMLIFDECVGVHPLYWEGATSMFKPEHGHFWVVACNPTDTTSHAYIQERTKGWRVFGMSSLDHPNITAELAGEDPPVPAAVSCSQIDDWVRQWCRPITEEERDNTDIQWRDPDEWAQGNLVIRWYRPGPSFQARAQGQWPREAGGVWWDALWDSCTDPSLPCRCQAQKQLQNWTCGNCGKKIKIVAPPASTPELGCDVARSSSDGSDDTTFHGRWGNCSIHHEWVNGYKTTQTVGRLIELCRDLAERANRWRRKQNMILLQPEEIPMKIDDSNAGGGVVDRLREQGFKAIGIAFGGASSLPLKYPSRRSELWFSTSDKALHLHCGLWFGELPEHARDRIREELMAVQWQQDSSGRRVVEEKKITKKKLGRSPDSADGLNLSYLDAWTWEPPTILPPQEKHALQPQRTVGQTRRSMWGR